MAECGVASCSNGDCCSPNYCCGAVCCDKVGWHCCGDVCCQTSEFYCGDSGACCSEDSDACGFLVGGAFNNVTLTALCTSTASTLANSTITISLIVSGSSSTVEITGSSGALNTSSTSSSTASETRAPSAASTSGENNGSDHISAGAIAGIVVGVAAIVFVLGALIIWRRRRQGEKAEANPYKPPGGRYELGEEKYDSSKHRPEVEGNGLHEMDVPPTEIDGEREVFYELPVESRPVEIDHASRD